VLNVDGGWEVRREGADSATARTSTQEEAVEKAHDIVRSSGGGELFVLREDGGIRSRETVGPARPAVP
jgi:hypothetical protein